VTEVVAEEMLLLIERLPKDDINGAVVRDDVCIMSVAAADATRRVINTIFDIVACGADKR